MTQQLILHLVVNWEVFTINICCFIAKIFIWNLYLQLFWLLIKLGLRSRGQIYTTMQNFIKIGHTRYHFFSIFTARGYAKRGICRRRVSVCVSVCMSVCVSVCVSHCGNVSKRLNVVSRKQRRMIALWMILVFWCQRSWRNSNGITPYGGDNGWVKIGHFRRKTRYNSKTVQDRSIVSIKVE